MTTIDWLHYDALFSVMTAHGFTSEPHKKGGITFRHPHGEILVFPPVKPTDPVVNYHYAAVRMAMRDYNIMTVDAFELALLQATHRLPSPAQP